jgi:hypothetical protein
VAEIYLKNQWVWTVCGLGGGTKTFLNRLATNVQILFTLNDAAVVTGDVPSDNPEINIPLAADGEAFVSYNSRLLYGFRREASGSGPPYVCRFAGVMHILEDEATSDDPVTHFQAYDPWMWLRSLPVVDGAGDLLAPDGLVYSGKTGDYIVKDLIDNALTAVLALHPTNPVFVDVSSGHFDTTDVIPEITFQQGVSVGEAWTQLTDTGSLDIVLTPVYDPVSRPGKLAVLSVYSQAGSAKNNAVFGWDKFPRTLVGISRLLDGTQMANVGQFYAGGLSVPQQTDAISIAEYGQYWLQRNYPSPASSSAVALVALAEVALRKKGKRTLTIDPTPELSPDPFTDYFLGDLIPVWAGRPQAGGGYSFREILTPGSESTGEWTNPQRVYAIPISLDDDQVETVTRMLLTDPNV